jgi:hypothetical protein
MNPADAEETVQDAVRLFLKAGGRADPNDPKALLAALGSNINGIAVNRRRKKAELAVQLTTDGVPAEFGNPPDAEQQIIDDEIARKAVSTLLDRMQGDEVATGILLKIIDGVEDAADQAKELGCAVREVYNARRRLKIHVEAVKQLMETW